MPNPWTALPAEPPFWLPGDAPAIEQFNRRARPEREIHLDLLPEPFVGSADAPVVLLSLIPGVSEGDRQVHARSSLQNAVRRNLRHQPQAYPFYNPLAAQLSRGVRCGGGGALWWCSGGGVPLSTRWDLLSGGPACAAGR